MDGNGLKVLNDTFGHAYGDKAIKDIALALTRILPSDGLVVRMGGDEFLCVVPRVGKGQAMHLVGLLENSVANATRDKDHAISVSAGFAAYPDDGEGFMDLLEIADQRMYTSKSRAYGLTEADDILNMSPELGEFEQLERQKSAHREGDSHQVVPNQDT